jgi:hypothetical protein
MYIKQDDVFYPPDIFGSTLGPVNNSSGDSRLIANGSLRMDNREVYIQINYKTPSDIDESTGLMKFDNNYLQSLFSGMYRVLQVDSTFSGGQFVQTLQTVRLHRQTSLDNGGKTAGPVNQRNIDSPAVPGTAGLVPAAPNPSTLSPGTTGDQRAPGNAPVQDAAPPTTTVDQSKLAEVNTNADTQPISAATEIPAVAPPPVYDQAAEFKASQIRSIQTSIDVANQQLATAQREGDTVSVGELNTYISQLNQSLAQAQAQ